MSSPSLVHLKVPSGAALPRTRGAGKQHLFPGGVVHHNHPSQEALRPDLGACGHSLARTAGEGIHGTGHVCQHEGRAGGRTGYVGVKVMSCDVTRMCTSQPVPSPSKQTQVRWPMERCIRILSSAATLRCPLWPLVPRVGTHYTLPARTPQSPHVLRVSQEVIQLKLPPLWRQVCRQLVRGEEEGSFGSLYPVRTNQFNWTT